VSTQREALLAQRESWVKRINTVKTPYHAPLILIPPAQLRTGFSWWEKGLFLTLNSYNPF
jgi:hypothetical protein